MIDTKNVDTNGAASRVQTTLVSLDFIVANTRFFATDDPYEKVPPCST